MKKISKISRLKKILVVSTGSLAIASAGACLGPLNHAQSTKQEVLQSQNVGVLNGNVVTNFSDYPYMASINWTNEGSLYDSHYGGAAFITQNLLITAGHLVSDEKTGALIDPSEIKIAYGGLNLKDEKTFQTFKVTKIYRVPGYKKINSLGIRINDLAILQIDNPSTKVQTVSLPGETKEHILSEVGKESRIIGWGFSQAYVAVSAKLRFGDQINVSSQESKKYLNTLIGYGDSYREREMIGVRAISDLQRATQGDSGGPLLAYNNEIKQFSIIGVCSWVPDVDICPYSFYTRLDNPFYLEWIKLIEQENQVSSNYLKSA